VVLKKELNITKEKYESVKNELNELSGISQRCKSAEQMVRELQKELSNKTRAYIKLQEENEYIRNTLDEALQKLTKITKDEENLIDKRLIRSLILTYFNNDKLNDKKEILQLMANILNLNEEEKKQIGLISKNNNWTDFMNFFQKRNNHIHQNNDNNTQKVIKNFY
jgi:polyribonucleotide nucleotidyltransferase